MVEAMMDRLDFSWLEAKRSRLMLHLLIASLTLNLAFIATLFYFGVRDRALTRGVVKQGHATRKTKFLSLPPALNDLLSLYLEASFDELAEHLSNEDSVEQGQLVCDLAFAALAQRHFFAVEQALPGVMLEKRPYAVQHRETGQWEVVTLFAGLSKDQRAAVRDFARYERWPLTAEGLFLALQARAEKAPASLKQAFYLSAEFQLVYQELKRHLQKLRCDDLLPFLLRVSWKEVKALHEGVVEAPCDAGALFFTFFHHLFARGDQEAGLVLFSFDKEAVFRHLTDKEIECLLNAFEVLTPEVEMFLTRLETSLRSDHIRSWSVHTLKRLGGECQEHREKISKGAARMRTYVIRQNDTLWKISRHFGVPVVRLKALNGLKSDVVVPGKTLVIPEEREASSVSQS